MDSAITSVSRGSSGFAPFTLGATLLKRTFQVPAGSSQCSSWEIKLKKKERTRRSVQEYTTPVRDVTHRTSAESDVGLALSLHCNDVLVEPKADRGPVFEQTTFANFRPRIFFIYLKHCYRVHAYICDRYFFSGFGGGEVRFEVTLPVWY